MQKKFLTLLVAAFLLVMLVTVTALADSTAIAIVDGKLTGIDANTTYEYQKLTGPKFELGEYATYDPESSELLEAGLYAVREADSESFEYALVMGSNAYTLTRGRSATEGQGVWTIKSPLGNLNPGNYTNGFATQVTLGSTQPKFLASTYSYIFMDDEIVPVKNVAGFNIRKSNNQGDHIRYIDPDGGTPQKIPGVAIFHVIGGTQDSYKVPFTWNALSDNTTIPIMVGSVAGDDAEGYIYKIEIDLIDTSASGIEIVDEATLDQALATLNLRQSREGGGYNELGGFSATSYVAGDYFYYATPGKTTGAIYNGVGTTGELVYNEDGTIKTWEYGDVLGEGEYATFHAENFKAISYLDADRYVMTGCTYRNTTSFNDYYTYQMLIFKEASNDRIVLTQRSQEAAPEITVTAGDVEGTYVISGLDPNKAYSVSNDGKVFTNLTSYTSSYTVEGTETTYIRTNGTTLTYASDPVAVVIGEKMPSIPNGTIWYDETDGKVKGLDYVPAGYESVTYEYTGTAILNAREWTAIPAGTTELDLELGYYVFRIAAQDGKMAGSALHFVAIEEEGNGTISHMAQNTYLDGVFEEGLWDAVKINAYQYRKVYNEGTRKRIIVSHAPNPEN